MFDVAFVDQQQVIDAPGNDGLRKHARRAHGDAVGNRARALRVMRALDGVDHARKARRLHANDLNARFKRLGCRGNTGNQAAATHSHYQRVQFRHRLQHFQPHRALTRDDGLVVIRVDKHQAVTLGQQQRMLAGFIQRVAVQHDVGTKAACALNFHARCEARHDDDGANSQALGVISHTLRVVARTHGDHPPLPLHLRQLRQLVTCATLFKRRGVLQVFELQVKLCSGELRQRARFHAGRVQQVALQALGGLFNVVQTEHLIPFF